MNENLLYKHVGSQLRLHRIARNLSQMQLADAVGLLRTSITNIEAGRQRVPLHVLYQLCSVLQIEVLAVLPRLGEIQHTRTEPITHEGVTENVPPLTAEFLRQIIDE